MLLWIHRNSEKEQIYQSVFKQITFGTREKFIHECFRMLSRRKFLLNILFVFSKNQKERTLKNFFLRINFPWDSTESKEHVHHILLIDFWLHFRIHSHMQFLKPTKSKAIIEKPWNRKSIWIGKESWIPLSSWTEDQKKMERRIDDQN